MSGPYQGQIQDRSSGDGDGDGDGDCQVVERTIVTEIDFNSGALLNLSNDFTTPAFGGGEAQIDDWSAPPGSAGGHTTVDAPAGEIDVSDDLGFDVEFETTYGLNLMKTGTGACDVALRVKADYGPGASALVLDELVQGVGSSAADEMPPVSRSVLVPTLAAIQQVIPTANQTPVLSLHIEQLDAAGGNVIVKANSNWYAKQIFPKVTTETIQNCESSTPPPVCPNVTEVRIYDNRDPGNRVLLTTKGPGAPAFVLGQSQFIPIYVEIDIDQDISPPEWALDWALGDTPDPPIAIGYASQTWQLSYTQPAPSGGSSSTAVARLSQLRQFGSCEFSEALTTTFIA